MNDTVCKKTGGENKTVFKKGKQKFTQQEIIDILKRNVNLFKDEEEFVQYIVDLALYLVEHRLYTGNETHHDSFPIKPTAAAEPIIMKRDDRYRRTRERDEELYQVLKKHSTRSDVQQNHCRMCGAPVSGGRAICSNCGNMVF